MTRVIGSAAPLESDSLCTPEWILEVVRSVERIALDPCSNPQSTVGAMFELSRGCGIDGLTADWWYYIGPGFGLAYVNPPYSRGNLLKWAVKIREEAIRGCEIISLFPHDHTMHTSSQARCDIARRIGFVGGKHKTGMIRSAAVYHGPRPQVFAQRFSSIGYITLTAQG